MQVSADTWRELVYNISFYWSAADPTAADAPTSTREFKCHECSLCFASRKAMLQHRRVLHDEKCEARLWIDSSATCPVCKVKFGSRLRAIAHLTDPRRDKCSSQLLHHPKLDPNLVEELDAADTVARTAAKRQGRPTPLAPCSAILPTGGRVGRAQPGV